MVALWFENKNVGCKSLPKHVVGGEGVTSASSDSTCAPFNKNQEPRACATSSQTPLYTSFLLEKSCNICKIPTIKIRVTICIHKKYIKKT